MKRQVDAPVGRWLIGLWILAFVATAPVWAETEPDDEQDAPPPAGRAQVEEPEYVEVNLSYIPTSNTIAAKLPVPLSLTPANVGAVSSALFREQDAFTLSDVLRNVSSINVQPQGGVHDYFLIRGFDSVSGSSILTDGAVEPEATHYPLYNVEGVEVLKGPAGFLYGNDPLAGVVNIVRKQPLPSDFLHFGASVGSFSTGEALLDWNTTDSSGNRSFRLNGLYQETDNFRDDKESRHRAVNPGFALRLDDGSTLNFNLEYVRAEYNPDSGIPTVGTEIPDVPRERSYQAPSDFSDQEIYRFQVDYEKKLNERVTLRNKFYHRDLDWQTRGTQFAGVFPGFNPGDLLVSRFQTTLDDRQRFSGNQLEAIFELGGGRVKHRVLTGVELKYTTDDFDIGVVPPEDPLNMIPGVPAIDLFNPIETATELAPFPFLTGESDSFIVAPYAIDQMTLSPRWELMLGARYDRVSRDDKRTAFGPPTLQESLSRDDGEVSPMVGVVFAATPSLSIYANGAQSFAPAGVRVFGNLDPEESTGFELGAKKSFLDDKVRTTFAVYEIERENVGIPDDSGVTQQAGDQSSRGFELDFAAEPLPGLRTFFSYAYTDAELDRFAERVIVGFDPQTGPIEQTVDRSGNTPAYVPDHLMNLWVSKSFGRGIGVGVGARYWSDQFIAEDNVVEIDGAVVLDAALFYDFKNCRVTLNLKNLTDEEYERRGFGSTSVIPGNGFAAYVGFDWRM